ncbi:MAG: hypothetical protein WC466_02895 [Candidatus Izemoplasmatales bacterium]
MLSENYKKRIQELAGLLIEGNEDKLRSFGINNDISKYLTNIDEKLSIFLANILISEYAKKEDIDVTNIKDTINLIDQGDFLDFIEDNKEKLNYIIEWIKSPFRVGEINLKDIADLSQAFSMAEEWHKSIQDTGIIKDESGDIIKTYPKEGFYWIDLKTNYSEDEANAMGHCGKDSRATTLISLRDAKKVPHVTIAYNEDNKAVTQVKGRKNQRPLPQYMKYVYDFLKEMIENGKLKEFQWSFGKDLDENEIQYVFEGNLEVYIDGVLKQNLNSNIKYKAPSVSKEEIINVVGKEKYAEYVKGLLQKNIENPNFGLTMRQSEIVDAVGNEEFGKYINNLLDVAIQNVNVRIPFSKSEILKYADEEKYNKYISSMLSMVLENPTKNKISLNKDEMYSLLGQEKYREFINELLKKIVTVSNSERTLKYLLNKHDIKFDLNRVQQIVGNKIWFFFLKRSVSSEQSNIGAGRID